jgi:hypothetical protein
MPEGVHLMGVSADEGRGCGRDEASWYVGKNLVVFYHRVKDYMTCRMSISVSAKGEINGFP